MKFDPAAFTAGFIEGMIFAVVVRIMFRYIASFDYALEPVRILQFKRYSDDGNSSSSENAESSEEAKHDDA